MTASQWFSVDVSQWVVVAIVENEQGFWLLCISQLWTFCEDTDKSDKIKRQILQTLGKKLSKILSLIVRKISN